MSKTQNYIDVLLPFLKKAGRLAITKQNELIASDKDDGSIVTETDLAISNTFQEVIKENFKNHSILDEETALKEVGLRDKLLQNEYIWVIDPIDGTKTYYHGSDLFALALSLYRNKKPVFGLIYLPASGQLIYNDETSVYRVRYIFTENETKNQIYFRKKPLNNNSLVYFPVKEAKDHIKNYKYTFIDGYSSYIYAFDVILNVAHGAFLKHNISMWDVYSTLPISNKLGINIYNIENGEELTTLDFNLFQDNLKAKNIWLICHSEYKDDLLSIL